MIVTHELNYLKQFFFIHTVVERDLYLEQKGFIYFFIFLFTVRLRINEAFDQKRLAGDF